MSNQFTDAFNAIFYKSPEQKKKDKRRWIIISFIILLIIGFAIIGVISLFKWIF